MVERRISLPFSAFVLAAGIVVGCVIVGFAIHKARSETSTIEVDGTARRIVHSDYIIWDADVTSEETSVADAYGHLEDGTSRLTKYLADKGIKPSEIFPLAIKTKVLYEGTQSGDAAPDESTYRVIKGYRLTQTIEVRSSDVAAIETVSRTVTDLIKQGVSLESEAPQYRIVKLADVKDSLIAEAAANARIRAGQIAQSSGARLGALKHSSMGFISVTGAYEDAQGNGEDTASVDKKITVMVSSSYEIK
jgi:hypothetical protein